MVFNYIHDFLFDVKDIEKKMEFGHPLMPPAIIVFYVVFCKWIGPALMKNREPFDLRITLIAYNFFQIIANSIIVYKLTEDLLVFWDIRCEREMSPKYLSRIQTSLPNYWHIYLVKFTDLLDTVFFVLRKKYKQITFLHLFHHALMCLLCYVVFVNGDYGYYILVGITINSFIHIFMYLYYGLAAFGPQMQKHLWWKKYLTTMQIIQFVVVLLYMSINFATGCEKAEVTEITCFLFVLALLILFGNFYRKTFKTE